MRAVCDGVEAISMREKFVIVTNRRSGSNLLVSMLNSHPQIKCFRELMRATPRGMKKQGYRGVFRILDKVDAVYKNDRYRFGHPFEFVQTVFDSVKRDPKLLGFKIHLDQHPKFLLKLIQDPEWKLVVLERENKLAQFSSSEISRVTGQANAPKGAKIIHTKVKFNARKFARFVKREEKHWKRVRAAIKTSGKHYFSIQYTQLLSKTVMKGLLEFLGVESSVHLEPGTEKRNPSTILARFSNDRAAMQAIETRDCSHWAYEEMLRL